MSRFHSHRVFLFRFQIPAVHDFGLFMGLVVVMCYCTVTCIMPPTLFLWARYVGKCESRITGWRPWRTRPTNLTDGLCRVGSRLELLEMNDQTCGSPENMPETSESRLISGDRPDSRVGLFDSEDTEPHTDLNMKELNGNARAVIVSDMTDVYVDRDDTVSLGRNVSMESNVEVIANPLYDVSIEDVLQTDQREVTSSNGNIVHGNGHSICNGVVTEPRQSLTPIADGEGCGFVGVLHRFIKNWIARPVVKYRIIVLVAVLVLVFVSIVLASRLRTAKRPPRFFPAQSNLQRFIDEFYSASKQSVDCNRCSAFFNMNSAHKTKSPVRCFTYHHGAHPPSPLCLLVFECSCHF